jgi:hypothetical protein
MHTSYMAMHLIASRRTYVDVWCAYDDLSKREILLNRLSADRYPLTARTLRSNTIDVTRAETIQTVCATNTLRLGDADEHVAVWQMLAKFPKIKNSSFSV